MRANAFAAHLLLPEAELREAATAGGEFAALVVRFRVSPAPWPHDCTRSA
ncbi:ImmA/IrrE family metallo-endopeptidase [Streptacidiphilus monticola]